MAMELSPRVTLEERFVELQRAKQKRPRNSIPKLRRVPNHLRNRKDFAKHYLPKFLSIGPIHHGDPELHLGEQYKMMWAADYIESTKHTPQILHKRIADTIKWLKDPFAEDVLTNNNWVFIFADEGFHSLEEKLSWMLFVDGCSLLHILEKAKLDKPDQLNVKVDQLVLVIQDVLLLENQLPYLVLKVLWRDDNNDSTLIETMKNFLRCHHWTRNNYHLWHWDPSYDPPAHLLDLQRYIFILSTPPKLRKWMPTCCRGSLRKWMRTCRGGWNFGKDKCAAGEKIAQGGIAILSCLTGTGRSCSVFFSLKPDSPHTCAPRKRTFSAYHVPMEEDHAYPTFSAYHVPMEEDHAYRVPMEEQNNENNSRENSRDVMVTFRNIQELRATGIRLKPSKTSRPRDISFSHGWLVAELTLPEIIVDDSTTATFLNLIAYEMCPNFENDYGICSFAAFMDSLIDHPEDVKALRSAGILINSLGSDEEVANLFNIISSGLVPDTQAYSKVRAQIEKYYKNKWKIWIALGYHTYFSNPWAIIAFLAALLALVLTFVQTWFAIHPVD